MKLHIQNFQALKNCEIDLDPGNVYALIGKNGCGKSSILKSLINYDKTIFVTEWNPLTTSYSNHIKNYDYYLDIKFNMFSDNQKLWIRNEIYKTFSIQLEITDEGYIDEFNSDGIKWYAYHLIALLIIQNSNTDLIYTQILTFESPEISLHPHAIRALIKTFRDYAEKHNLVILLTTQSPIVLNQFNENPQNVLIVSPEKTVPITDIITEEYLSHFSLGTLYDHGKLDFPADFSTNLSINLPANAIL